MAYGFLERMDNEDVQMYLNEGMDFEAWITAMRETDLTAEEFEDKLEQEFMKKSSKLTEDEIWSLQVECMSLKRYGEWEEDYYANHEIMIWD